MNTDYAYLNQIIKDGKYKLSVACIKVLISKLNAKQKAYKHILTVDFDACLQTTYKWVDRQCFTYCYNPIQSKSKQTSTKLSILYSALNILDDKPTNHIPSDNGVAYNEVLPALIKIFDGTEWYELVKSIRNKIP